MHITLCIFFLYRS